MLDVTLYAIIDGVCSVILQVAQATATATEISRALALGQAQCADVR